MKFQAYSSIGSYPLLYLTKGTNMVLCASCAKEEYEEEGTEMEAHVNWESEDLCCDGCGEDIECAYPQDDDD